MDVRARAFATLLLTAVLGIGLGSCQGKAAADKAQKTLPTATISVKGVPVLAELARSEEELAKGLMFRKSLDDGKGMLFIFPGDERLSFWMKNTLIPLSIAYIAKDGTIMDILDMKPLSEAPVSTSHFVRFALEVPQGWFARAGIAVGDKVLLAAAAP
jgi:uncharacterized protein